MYLRDILIYLQQIDVHFYRVAATLFDEISPDVAIQQLDECATELDIIAEQVHAQDVRLTIHLGHHIALGSENATLVACSLAAIEVQARFLEKIDARCPSGTPLQSVMIVHAGGSPRDTHSLQRFATHYRTLSARARARLVVEHDDRGYSLGALLRLHQVCGIPVVFDLLHWQRNNPEHLPLDLALGLALATWPTEMRPKVHISTARSEAHLFPARHGHEPRILPPRPGQHADFINIVDLLHLLHAARGLTHFDLMVEAKAGDLALLRVREEAVRLDPDIAAVLG